MGYDYEGEIRSMEHGAKNLEQAGYHESAKLVSNAAKDCRKIYDTIKPLIADR